MNRCILSGHLWSHFRTSAFSGVSTHLHSASLFACRYQDICQWCAVWCRVGQGRGLMTAGFPERKQARSEEASTAQRMLPPLPFGPVTADVRACICNPPSSLQTLTLTGFHPSAHEPSCAQGQPSSGGLMEAPQSWASNIPGSRALKERACQLSVSRLLTVECMQLCALLGVFIDTCYEKSTTVAWDRARAI